MNQLCRQPQPLTWPALARQVPVSDPRLHNLRKYDPSVNPSMWLGFSMPLVSWEYWVVAFQVLSDMGCEGLPPRHTVKVEGLERFDAPVQ